MLLMQINEETKKNKIVKFKNCAPFTDWTSKINNTQVHNAKNLDVIMPMHNSIEHSHDYSKTSENLWHYYRDMSGEADNAAITDS